jgi:hypothetical protein
MKTVLLVIGIAATAAAQTGTLNCDEHGYSNRNQVTHCEMREQTVPFAGRLSVDGGVNGGVSVKGWDNGNVLVRARVEASGTDDAAARAVVSQITVNASAGQVSATGPSQGSHQQGWSVSYEIFVPRQADLNLKAMNGGLSISDVRGAIQFETMNGGVSLKRVAGDVEGKTMNGGLNIELAGARWDGAKLDARTVNGGVNLTVPANYSAHFEGSTVNGHLNLGIPATVSGEISKHIVTDLGSGGPTIHVETTNGGVNIKKM